MRRGRHEKRSQRRGKRVIAALTIVAAMMVSVPFANADAGGGPGSNHGCPGHQPPPPPGGGCGN
jgi:hypothetical protein